MTWRLATATQSLSSSLKRYRAPSLTPQHCITIAVLLGGAEPHRTIMIHTHHMMQQRI